MSQPRSIVHDVGIFDAQAETPQLSTAHEQTGVLSARNKRNLTGKGIKVGVIGNVSLLSPFLPLSSFKVDPVFVNPSHVVLHLTQ